tara:strand:+ start:19414 stop:19539 length:126 start_codon:yes stop_codon:yes gene_type:complete
MTEQEEEEEFDFVVKKATRVFLIIAAIFGIIILIHYIYGKY